MASCDPELLRLYLNRLVGSLVPPEAGSLHIESLVADLTNHITRPYSASSSSASASTPSLPQTLQEYHYLFLTQNRADEWRDFQEIVHALIRQDSTESVTRNLVRLSQLAPAGPVLQEAFQSSQRTFEQGTLEPNHMRTFGSPSGHATPSKAAKLEEFGSIYHTLDESVILEALKLILVGQDNTIFKFSADAQGIETINSLNRSYTRLLAEILEPALLAKNLHSFVISSRKSETSPIKTAFISFVDVYLRHYSDIIESIFRFPPKSLSNLAGLLDDQTHSLRLLGHLAARVIRSNGFDFLLDIKRLSNFGDARVAALAADLFVKASIPYYSYLENWVSKGELIDESAEFFVSFDHNENHINDIIKFDRKKLPEFLGLDDEFFMKAFQVGKTLIFLEKYCKDLDWVNEFSRRFDQFIFSTHNGIKSMTVNTLQAMVNQQYDEVLEHFMLVTQSRYLMFSHLLCMKRVMLMESNDFINVLTNKGAEMFRESALSLTSTRLSELLADSIQTSSLNSLPLEYRRRIDTRVLDLSHGTIGWDVFTLVYGLTEPPLEALLNYKNQSTQYLRMFNFLWSLKHYSFLLREHFLQFQEFHKNHLRQIKSKLKVSASATSKWTESRLGWLVKSLRIIALIRHRFGTIIDAILNFVSFDLIESSFHSQIVCKIFKTAATDMPGLIKGVSGEASRLSILSSSSLINREEMSLTSGLQNSARFDRNTHDLTIDDITNAHESYLKNISECKLLRGEAYGRESKKPFISQIYELLELTYTFLKSSQEFAEAFGNYVYVLRLRTENFDFEEEWLDLQKRLQTVETYISKDLYADKLKPWLKTFARDMRAEADLKDLSKMI